VDNAISAFDHQDRILYIAMTQAQLKRDYFLVGINVDTAQIVSHVVLCQVGTYCPWSLEWNN
jgi:hypothetical protein